MGTQQFSGLRFSLITFLCAIITFGGLSWVARNESTTRSVAAAPISEVTENKPEPDVIKRPPPDYAAESTEDIGSSNTAPTPAETVVPDSGKLMTVTSGEVQTPPESARTRAARGKSVAGILQDADMSDPATRARVVEEMRLLQASQQSAILEKARQLGIPVRKEGPGHKVSILYDFRGDEPLYRTTLNANAAISTGANLLAPAPYNLNGSGIKVGVWDGGSVRNTHQELTGRVTKRNSSSVVDDHATHVAGTIAAAGVQANAKGMAPQATIDSYDWDSDYTEMTAAGAATAGDTTNLPFSNHSYGYDAATADMGRYETEANSVDAIAASLPYYLPFWASGNEQDLLTAKGGYQSITFNGLAKNIMTIGAVDDALSNGIRQPANGLIAYFSSLGPCDDGRIKPDLVANGVNLYSPVSTSNTAYDGTYSGTSMATPNAMGSAVLLAQLHAREFSGQRMRASTVKALLIHTADDIGSTGPDYKYGWGLINVKAASDLILAHKRSLAAPKMIEGAITNAASTRTHSFTWDGVSPIRATLCWTDPAGTVQTAADSRSANLKHNLDAKITAPDGTTVYQPFVMPFVGSWSTASMATAAIKGKNNVDNVEQVYLAAPLQAGDYTVTVSLDGTLGTSSQVYSLIITGGSEIETNPPPDIALSTPENSAVFLPGVAVTVAATASDLTIGGAPGGISQVEFFSDTTSLGADSTPPYSVGWTPAASGSYTITARATDNEGAIANSPAVLITILTGNGVPVISSFTPASGPAGTEVVLTGLNLVNISSVKINGVEADYVVDSSTRITLTVPPLATTGTISAVNPLGNGTSENVFTVLQSPVLISQIYGAGGNSGATYRQDYIELYNRSDTAVSLAGWSLQYASAAGTTWSTALLSGSIAPGKYYLAGLGSGTSGAVLPTVDASGSINMSATNGKIALMNASTALTGSSPVGATGLQDFVGFGTANASEGTAAPSPSSTTAIFRTGGGGTDTGNNAADFAAAAPNPRNSASGPAVTPVITSALSASGTVGAAFNYQITATNVPTSYGASGLPAGLSVNSATGAITGSPTTAETANATITASNSAGTGSAILTLTLTEGGGTTEILREDFASIINGNNSTTGGSGTSWTGNSNFAAVSSAWQAGGAVKLGSGSTAGSITSRSLDLSRNAGNFKVSFKVKGWTTIEGGIKVTVTGLASQTVGYTSMLADGFETKTLAFIGGTANSTIKFETTAKRAFLDDVLVSYESSSAPPLITATGTLAAVDTTYGSASSAATSFVISGTTLTEGILVTAPAGFEVSRTPGGTTGYAPTQIITGSGTIAETTIHLRLAAGINAGSYSGDVLCTSSGAALVSIPLAPSAVGLKLATITADNLNKPFGSTLSLGPGRPDFISSGLVGSETIGTVTLTASGGISQNDIPGVYSITPGAATGGTFDPNNYDVSYVDGILTVTPLAFNDWLVIYPGLSDPTPAGDPDGDGVSNLMEYFSGLSPSAPDGGAVVSMNDMGNSLAMSYRRAKGISNVGGVVKWSVDLQTGSWSANGITETIEDKGSYEIRTATVTKAPGESAKFMRLEVSQP